MRAHPKNIEHKFSQRLDTRIVLSIGSLLLILALGVAALTFVQERQSAYDSLGERASTLADALNYAFETMLIHPDEETDIQRVAENSATIADVRRILIVDSKKTILASSDRLERGGTAHDPSILLFLDQHTQDRQTYLTDKNELIIIQPLRSGTFGGGNGGDLIGAIQVTLDRSGAEDTARIAAVQLLAISLGSYVLLSALLFITLQRMVIRPLYQLVAAARRFRSNDHAYRSHIQRTDEIGLLSATFDTMADEIETALNDLEGQVAARTADLQKLAKTLADLEASTNERAALTETVRALSTPVIRLHHHIVVMPLIGVIDSVRAQQIQHSLLHGIEEHHAQKVILDLTGVPIIDTMAAAALIRGMQAAQLLGVEMVIVGIAPEVAQSMVQLGVDFSGITTRADLQSGLLQALHSLGLTIAPIDTPDTLLTSRAPEEQSIWKRRR